jgi:hypothetical protein
VHLDFPCVLFSIIPSDLGELAFGLRLVRFVQHFFFLCWFSPFVVCRRRLVFLAAVCFSVDFCSAGAVTQFSFLGCSKRARGFGSYSSVLPQRQSALPSFLLPLTFCSHSLDFLGRIHSETSPCSCLPICHAGSAGFDFLPGAVRPCLCSRTRPSSIRCGVQVFGPAAEGFVLKDQC